MAAADTDLPVLRVWDAVVALAGQAPAPRRLSVAAIAVRCGLSVEVVTGCLEFLAARQVLHLHRDAGPHQAWTVSGWRRLAE
jgi:hypothetical protein